MFGGVVDDEDEAFAEARLKRAKKQEEVDEDELIEIDKAEMAAMEGYRREPGMASDAKAEKEVALSTLPQKMDTLEVVEKVKEEEKKANSPMRDLEIVDLDAVKEERLIEAKMEI